VHRCAVDLTEPLPIDDEEPHTVVLAQLRDIFGTEL